MLLSEFVLSLYEVLISDDVGRLSFLHSYHLPEPLEVLGVGYLYHFLFPFVSDHAGLLYTH